MLNIGFPCHNDRTSGSDEEMPENTHPLVRIKRKPIDFTMADLEAEKSDDGEEFVGNVSPVTTRKMPKRQCTISKTNDAFTSDSDDSIDGHVEEIVESAFANLDKHDDATKIVFKSESE